MIYKNECYVQGVTYLNYSIYDISLVSLNNNIIGNALLNEP